MATTKAFELAQISALTTVGADTSLADSLNLSASTHSFQISGTPVLSYSGGNVIVGDLGAGVGLEFNGSTHLITDAQGVNVTGELDVSGILDVAGVTTSTSTSTGALVVAGGAGIAENLNVGGNAGVTGNLTVTGDLTVEGSQVTLNTTALDVEDKNITLNYHASNDTSASADGAGITIQDAVNGTTDASILWGATYDEFSISHPIVVSNAIYSNGSSPRVQLQDTDGTNQFSFFQQSTSQLSLRLRNDSSDGSFLVAGYGGSTTTNRFLIGSTGDISFYENNGGSPQVGMHWDYADGRLGIGTDVPGTSLHIANANNSFVTLQRTSPSSGTGKFGINMETNSQATFAYDDSSKLIIGRSSNPQTQAGFSNDFVFDENGRLGIGVLAPTVKLDVNDAGVTDNAWNTLAKFRPDLSDQHAEASIHIQSYPSTTVVADRRAGIQSIDDAGNARALILNKDGGNIGIGTDDPQSHLEIEQTGSTVFDATDTSGQAGDGATLAIQNLSDTNDTFSQILFRNRNSSKAVSRIASITNGTGTHLVFVVENQSSAPSEVMRIEKTGQVGIGTNSPSEKLHVYHTGTATYDDIAQFDYYDTDDSVLRYQVKFGPNGGTRFQSYVTGGAPDFKIIDQDFQTGRLSFQVQSNAGARELLAVDSGGNVGIGTDTPSAFLHVRRDNNNTGNQFQVADFEGTTAGVRSYTTADGTGIIMNHYYAKSGGGNKYLRHADIVSNMGDGAAADFRFFTKDQDSNPIVAMSLSATGAIHTGAQQVRHNLQPALSLDFANSSTIDTRIQYAREGVATYFDRNGVMKYAQHNEPRIDYDPDTGECKGLLVEEQRTNWMTYPNEFGFNQWSLPGLTVFQNAGLAPDGTMSADLLIPDTSYTGRHFGYKVTTGAFLSGTTYNISCYFKAYGGFSESCKLGYRVDSDTQSGDLYGSGFQIANGEPAGNGWYRHSLTVAVGTNASLNFAEFIIGDQNGYTPTGGKGVYLWGFSVEKAVNNTATFPTSFIPTIQKFKTRASTSATYTRSDGVITTAGQNQSRYDHGLVDGVWRSKGLLLESAATNISQNFYYPASTLRWQSGVQNATITPDTTILAPDGSYNNVVRFKETTNNAATTASVYKPIAGTANTQRCFSVYAKKKELKMMRLYFDGTTPLCGQVIYNLDLGTIHIAQNPSNTDAWGIEDAGNGWWRCWFSGTVTGGQTTYYLHIDSADDFGNTSHQNTVNNGFYLWGPQMEYGGAPTSYIYTDDSAVTRAADLCDAEEAIRYGDDIKIHDLSWYNSQESTIYGEGTSISANNDTGSNPAMWGLTDGTSSNRYLLRRFSNDVTNDPTYGGYTFRLQQTMPDGTGYNNDFFSPTADGLGEWDDSNVHKMAMSISPGNQIGAADGRDAQITSVTTMPAYTQPTMVQIGYAGSSDYWNGHIRKLAYYPTQLNISEMKALTETDT